MLAAATDKETAGQKTVNACVVTDSNDDKETEFLQTKQIANSPQETQTASKINEIELFKRVTPLWRLSLVTQSTKLTELPMSACSYQH